MSFIRAIVVAGVGAAILSGGCLAAATGAQPTQPALPAASGQLTVTFLYMPPTELEPTYHTAMWLEDKSGKLIKTLFVSNELSNQEYKVGDACPDWVKQASWEKAEKPLVDAVTGPTPNVGNGAFTFDLAKLGIGPGTYIFNFQVHLAEKYNVRFRGTFNAGNVEEDVKIEVLFSPGKPPADDNIIRDVYVKYTPAAGQ